MDEIFTVIFVITVNGYNNTPNGYNNVSKSIICLL